MAPPAEKPLSPVVIGFLKVGVSRRRDDTFSKKGLFGEDETILSKMCDSIGNEMGKKNVALRGRNAFFPPRNSVSVGTPRGLVEAA